MASPVTGRTFEIPQVKQGPQGEEDISCSPQEEGQHPLAPELKITFCYLYKVLFNN